MSGRKIVVDLQNLERLRACPTCGTALSAVDRATLQPITASVFRCLPGRQPRAFEARCAGCGRWLVVSKRDADLVLVSADQDAIAKWLREAEREAAWSGERRRRERGG